MVNILTHWNGFVQRKRSTPLGTSELALYYVLMEHWNGLGRPEWLSVAAGVLQAESGLSDTTFKRARQQLCRKGYINYRQGTGRSAARYHLLDMGAAVPPRVACPQGKHPSPHTVSANEVSGSRCDGGAAVRPSLALPRSGETGEPAPGERDRREAGTAGVGGAAVPPRVACPQGKHLSTGPLCGRGRLAKQTPEPTHGEHEQSEVGADVVGGHTVSANEVSGSRCDGGAAVRPSLALPQAKQASMGSLCGQGGLAKLRDAERSEAGRALPDHRMAQSAPPEPTYGEHERSEVGADVVGEHTASANEVNGSRCDGGAPKGPSLACPQGKQASPHTVSATNGSGNRCDGLAPVKRGLGETKDMGVDGKMAHKAAHKVAHKMAHNVAPLNKEKEKEKENQHPLAGMLETVEWKNYAQMRLKMKRPLEPRAVHMALDKLLALAPGDTDLQRRILDQSTFFYWKDLYALERRGAQDGAGAAGAGQAAQERMAGVDINELARRSAEERAACGRGWLAKLRDAEHSEAGRAIREFPRSGKAELVPPPDGRSPIGHRTARSAPPEPADGAPWGRAWLAQQTGEYGAAVPPRVACHPSPHTVSTTNGSGNRCDGFYAQEHVVRLAAAGCERDRREA